MMSRISQFLLENETYEDGLKRALRSWDAKVKELEKTNLNLLRSVPKIREEEIVNFEHWLHIQCGKNIDLSTDSINHNTALQWLIKLIRQ